MRIFPVVVGDHRDTSPSIIFNLTNQEIRAKCVLSWNTWRGGNVWLRLIDVPGKLYRYI